MPFAAAAALVEALRGNPRQWRRVYDIVLALEVQGQMESSGDAATRVYNGAIEACGRAGQLALAISVFERMPKRGARRTDATFLALLHSCQIRGAWSQCLLTFTLMRSSGLRPAAEAHCHLACSFVRSGKLKRALAVMQSALSDPAVGWGATQTTRVVAACGSNSNAALALLQSAGASVTVPTLDAAIFSCALAGNAKAARSLLTDAGAMAARQGHVEHPNAVLNRFGHVLMACRRARSPADALSVFTMLQVCARPRPVEYEEVLDALASGNKLVSVNRAPPQRAWRHSVRLINEMRASGMRITSRAFDATMLACSKAGNIESVLQVRSQMRQAGVPPSSSTSHVLLTIFGRKGLHFDAQQVYDEMKRLGWRRGPLARSLLLGALLRGKQWRAAMKAFEAMREGDGVVEGGGPIPDPLTCALAADAYAALGESTRALALRNALRKSRPKRTTPQARDDFKFADRYIMGAAVHACARTGRWDEIKRRVSMEKGEKDARVASRKILSFPADRALQFAQSIQDPVTQRLAVSHALAVSKDANSDRSGGPLETILANLDAWRSGSEEVLSKVWAASATAREATLQSVPVTIGSPSFDKGLVETAEAPAYESPLPRTLRTVQGNTLAVVGEKPFGLFLDVRRVARAEVPAAQSGVVRGDMIVAVAGTPVSNVTVAREFQRQPVPFVLELRPAGAGVGVAPATNSNAAPPVLPPRSTSTVAFTDSPAVPELPRRATKLPQSEVKDEAAKSGSINASGESNISKSVIPDGWESVLDKETGDTYYWNLHTDEVSWERPRKPAKPSAPPDSKPAAKPKGADATATSYEEKRLSILSKELRTAARLSDSKAAVRALDELATLDVTSKLLRRTNIVPVLRDTCKDMAEYAEVTGRCGEAIRRWRPYTRSPAKSATRGRKRKTKDGPKDPRIHPKMRR